MRGQRGCRGVPPENHWSAAWRVTPHRRASSLWEMPARAVQNASRWVKVGDLMVDGRFAYRPEASKARDSCQVLTSIWAVVKRYPDGDRLKLDATFRREAQKFLDEHGMSHGDLAKLVGSTREAISQLLSLDRGPKTSKLVLPVARITGATIPGYEDDKEIASFGRALKRIRSGDPHAYARLVGRIEEVMDRLDRVAEETERSLSEIGETGTRGAEKEANPRSAAKRTPNR
jgi:hypothetical protein